MIGVQALVLMMASVMVTRVTGHTYHLGDCPIVEPQSGFEMSRFLGMWYVVQKTSTGSRCLYYNITQSPEPYEYTIEQVSEHPALGVVSVDNKYHYTGTLKVPQKDTPARMTVKFPLNPIGKSSFVVFITDYDTYAGIYTCQELPASNRRSASILSRKPILDKQYIDKIRLRMSGFGVNPYDLSLIDQSKCPKETNIDLGIDPDTFSASNIAAGVRKAGEKIGDGIEVVAAGGKRVYDSVNKDSEVELLK